MTIFTYIAPPLARTLKKIGVCVKDNIAVKGMPMTCASRHLQSFTPDYTAHCLSVLPDHYTIVGKCNMDEFGMGSHTAHSIHGRCPHPHHPELSAGGSSGGCAAAVALGHGQVGVGSDTGGSVRLPAAFCGLVGFKPEYGGIERHGLVEYAPSLDTIGLMARKENVDLLWQTYLLMRNNGTAVKCEDPKEIILFYDAKEYCNEQVWRETIEFAESVSNRLKLPVRRVEFKLFAESIAAYYAIASIEAWSSLQRYPLYASSRTGPYYPIPKGHSNTEFGEEVQKRLRLAQGLLSLKNIIVFDRATLLRQLITNNIQTMASRSIIILPCAPAPPPVMQDANRSEYDYDIFTVPFSLAGVPVWTVPLPTKWTGVQIVSSNPEFVYNNIINS